METALALLLCNMLNGGETEDRRYFPSLGETRHIRVDCQTPTHVIEIGRDNTASLRDSVHQAVFAHVLTGLTPMVIVIDSDGQEDRYEQELRLVAAELEIAYAVCHADFLHRWAATAPWRDVAGLDKDLGDLPVPAVATQFCDLQSALEQRVAR